jgi:hypothetical protein
MQRHLSELNELQGPHLDIQSNYSKLDNRNIQQVTNTCVSYIFSPPTKITLLLDCHYFHCKVGKVVPMLK